MHMHWFTWYGNASIWYKFLCPPIMVQGKASTPQKITKKQWTDKKKMTNTLTNIQNKDEGCKWRGAKQNGWWCEEKLLCKCHNQTKAPDEWLAWLVCACISMPSGQMKKSKRDSIYLQFTCTVHRGWYYCLIQEVWLPQSSLVNHFFHLWSQVCEYERNQ